MAAPPYDSLTDALIRQMNLQLDDMKYNGEYPLLLSLIQGQAALSQRIARQQDVLVSARKRAGTILTAARPQPQSNPARIQRAQRVLEEAVQESQDVQREIRALEEKLREVASLSGNKEEIRRAALALANRENTYREELIELYHSISGVHWDQPDLGYVLSEEIAKPIRFDSCLDATNQLWEMINM